MRFASQLPSRRFMIGCWSAGQRKYHLQRLLILDMAADVFGSRSLALRWFESPAIAFNRFAPCQMVKLPHGYFKIRIFLRRIDFCVYI